jgi:hypothetical protein
MTNPAPRYRLNSFSLTTKLVIVCIAALSFSGREILKFGVAAFGHEEIRLLVKFGIVLAGLYSLSGFSLTRDKITAAILLIVLGVVASMALGLPEEQVHLIMFAVLGASLFRDFRPAPAAMTYAIVIGITVGGLDELLQAALPWRVGDLRDVFINALGVIWGVLAQNSASKPNVANP